MFYPDAVNEEVILDPCVTLSLNHVGFAFWTDCDSRERLMTKYKLSSIWDRFKYS